MVRITTKAVEAVRKSFDELLAKHKIPRDNVFNAKFHAYTGEDLSKIPGFLELREKKLRIRTQVYDTKNSTIDKIENTGYNAAEELFGILDKRIGEYQTKECLDYYCKKQDKLFSCNEFDYLIGPEALKIEKLAQQIDEIDTSLQTFIESSTKVREELKENRNLLNYHNTSDYDEFCSFIESQGIRSYDLISDLYNQVKRGKISQLNNEFKLLIKKINSLKSEKKAIESQMNNLTNPVESPSVELQQLNDYYRSLENAQKASKTRRRNHHLYNVKKQKEINSNIERQRERHSRVVDLYGEKLTISNGGKFDLSNSNISLPYNSTTIGKLKELRGTRSELIDNAKHIFAEEMGYPSELISLKAPEGIRFGDAEFDFLKGCIYIKPTKFGKYADYSILRHEMDHLDKAARLCATVGIDEFEKIFSTKYPGATINRDFWTKIIEYAKPLSKEEVVACRKAITGYNLQGNSLDYDTYSYFNNYLEDSAYKKQISLLSSLNSKAKKGKEGAIIALKMQEIRQNIIQNPDLDLKKYGERYYFEKAVDDLLESIDQSAKEIDYLDLLDNVSKKLKG